MKNKVLWTISLIPLFLTVIVIPFMENNVPIRFDKHGNINRWGSKYEHFFFPFLIIVFALIFHFVVNYFNKMEVNAEDDKKKKYAKSNRVALYYAGIISNLFFLVFHVTAICFALVKV